MQTNQRFPYRLFLCELSGTAVLVLGGLSLVIVLSARGYHFLKPMKPILN